MFHRVLLCIDGKRHTNKAVSYALQLVRGTQAELTVLHVIDGFLLEKRISHEIYAVGRNEYRAYIRKELQKEADAVIRKFSMLAKKTGIDFEIKLRSGHPVEEVLKEIQENRYDLVILGGKTKRGLAEFKSRNLPMKVFRKSKVPVMVVR